MSCIGFNILRDTDIVHACTRLKAGNAQPPLPPNLQFTALAMALFCIPKCPSCIRPLAGGAFQQIRGKKKVAKVTTVTVRLLKDVAKFGKAGMVARCN